MNISEVIQRQRIFIVEFRTALVQLIEVEAKKQLDNLANLELRVEKENLTGGQVSIPAAVLPNDTPSPQQVADSIIDAETIAPSLKEKR